MIKYVIDVIRHMKKISAVNRWAIYRVAEELLIPKLAKAVEMEFGYILAVEAD